MRWLSAVHNGWQAATGCVSLQVMTLTFWRVAPARLTECHAHGRARAWTPRGAEDMQRKVMISCAVTGRRLARQEPGGAGDAGADRAVMRSTPPRPAPPSCTSTCAIRKTTRPSMDGALYREVVERIRASGTDVADQPHHRPGRPLRARSPTTRPSPGRARRSRPQRARAARARTAARTSAASTWAA